MFKRKRLEHVSQMTTYPELPIGRRARAVLRYLLGRPMDNVRWTNATFFRDATSGEGSRWLRLAGWKRAVMRVLLPYALLLLLPVVVALCLLREWSMLLLLLIAHLLLSGSVLLPLLLLRRWRDYGLRLPMLQRVVEQDGDAELRRRWSISGRELITGRKVWQRERVLPLARSLTAALQLPVSRLHPREVDEWVSVPKDYREQGGGAVVIQLPGHFAMQERARVALVRSAAERLGMRDPSASWQLEGEHPRLLLSAPVLPPKLITPADVMQRLLQLEEYTFLLGAAAGGELLTVSLKEDSPHIALSAGSGAGKSELIKSLVAQMLRWGWSVIILDWKGESQEWAENLPGVRYVREVEHLHDTVVEIGNEIEWRRLHRGVEHQRIGVVSEEWGITAPLLAEYWTALRGSAEPEEKRTMPLRSPAITAGMKINFTGRSLGVSQMLVAQRFSARVTNGNADLRESFGTILMSRWKSQTVKMLAPDVKPFPKKITTPGRWVAVNGDEAVVFQAVLWSDEEAREFARGGKENPHSPWSERYGRSSVATDQRTYIAQGDQLRPVATSHSSLPVLEGREVMLRKLVDIATTLEYLDITHEILRKAARSDDQGDPDFPKVCGGTQFKGYLYDLSEVTEWAKKMRAAQAAEKSVKA